LEIFSLCLLDVMIEYFIPNNMLDLGGGANYSFGTIHSKLSAEFISPPL
jgi:hypothetical protein